MKQVTWAKVWKNNPKVGHSFISDYIKETIPSLKKHGKVKKILDVACGNGLGASLPLLRMGFDVYAFDLYKSSIEALKINAKKENFKIQTKKADMYKKFPYKDNTFDSTFCFKAIMHGRIEQIMFCLSEIKRVTKKGGYFFGSFMNYEDIKIDSKRRFYFDLPSTATAKRAYPKQVKEQPHLFIFQDKAWEYLVPHYFHAKNELKALLEQFFVDIKIKKTYDNCDEKVISMWYAEGRVK